MSYCKKSSSFKNNKLIANLSHRINTEFLLKKRSNLVWMDLEFSGLNPDHDVILEIATIVTDSELNVLGTGPHLIIHQSDAILDNMDEWNTTHHGRSGLTERVRKSKETHASADTQTLDFISMFCKKGEAPLCGNSIHQDRRYLYKYMPKVSEYLHYRNIDVSTVKELAKRWHQHIPSYPKQENHRALDDIKESIEELKFYRQKLFPPKRV
jgi:oligoribonuclease